MYKQRYIRIVVFVFLKRVVAFSRRFESKIFRKIRPFINNNEKEFGTGDRILVVAVS